MIFVYFSFQTPVYEDGLYVNLETLQAFGKKFVSGDSERTGCKLYLMRRTSRIPTTVEEREEHKIEKLAIGVEGGFNHNGIKLFNEITSNSLYVPATDSEVPLDHPEVPSSLQILISEIDSFSDYFDNANNVAWEDELIVTKHADDLPLNPNFLKCSPNVSEWKCMVCGRTDNLWMNLSDGFIGCGRKQWGVPETGCSQDREGAAVLHFDETGRKYPLAVKLRTISASGGDVFSYAEDDLVKNPKLKEHLFRLGINIMNMEKSEKSMLEMQLELNKTHEFSLVMNEGSELDELKEGAKGLVGMTNIGNSCYITSLMQALLSHSSFISNWSDPMLSSMLLEKVTIKPHFDFATDPIFQMMKLAVVTSEGYHIDEYKKLKESWVSMGGDATEAHIVFHDVLNVKPRMFKLAFAKRHPEFSSGKQQDAEEYLQYMASILHAALKHTFMSEWENGYIDQLSVQRQSEFRLAECYLSHDRSSAAVVHSTDSVLRLPIPMHLASNNVIAEKKTKYLNDHNGDEESAPVVDLNDCLGAFRAQEDGITFRGVSNVSKSVSIANFPSLLIVQAQRFYADVDWTAKKLDVEINFPPEVLNGNPVSIFAENLTNLEMNNIKNLEPLGKTESEECAPTVRKVVNEEFLGDLLAMGIDEETGRRALVKVDNASVASAIDMIFNEQITTDMPTDFPYVENNNNNNANKTVEDIYNITHWTAEQIEDLEESTMMVHSIGCEDVDLARKLMILTKNDSNRIVEEFFSTGSSFDVILSNLEASLHVSPSLNGGNGLLNKKENELVADVKNLSGAKYVLKGIVTHIGKSSDCGHYISHVRREIDGDDRWVRMNDDKAEISIKPPVGRGYLLVFEHVKQ